MRIAAVQSRPIVDDPALTIGSVVDRLGWADREGADMIVFPEAFLLGHSYDPEAIRSHARGAADAMAALCDRVAGFAAALVIGAFEMVEDRLFNHAVVIEGGDVVGRYAKAFPNEPGVTAGNDFPTFVRSGVRYGINICADANHPAAAQRLADGGARLILYPLNNMLPAATAARWRSKSLANLVDRARQTGCWVVSSDVVGSAGDWVSHGCTAIVSPDGDVVARVPEGSEGVVVHDLG